MGRRKLQSSAMRNLITEADNSRRRGQCTYVNRKQGKARQWKLHRMESKVYDLFRDSFYRLWKWQKALRARRQQCTTRPLRGAPYGSVINSAVSLSSRIQCAQGEKKGNPDYGRAG